ncbi:MAG: hypothetical protein QF860_03660 [Planctomycetota bacterium]|nr:hypothetical protein [Planctomycetota bacterium]
MTTEKTTSLNLSRGPLRAFVLVLTFALGSAFAPEPEQFTFESEGGGTMTVGVRGEAVGVWLVDGDGRERLTLALGDGQAPHLMLDGGVHGALVAGELPGLDGEAGSGLGWQVLDGQGRPRAWLGPDGEGGVGLVLRTSQAVTAGKLVCDDTGEAASLALGWPGRVRAENGWVPAIELGVVGEGAHALLMDEKGAVAGGLWQDAAGVRGSFGETKWNAAAGQGQKVGD